MGKYLTEECIKDLIHLKNTVFSTREDGYKKYSIDLLDNDTLSSLSIWEIVRQYDHDYNTNFARNGEDAMSNGVMIEQKCASVKPSVSGKIRNAEFQFHAMGDLEYPRYILVVRRKDTLSPVRLYDISDPFHTQLLYENLLCSRTKWLEKARKDEKKNMKYDVITLSEIFIKEKIKLSAPVIINNCHVFKG